MKVCLIQLAFIRFYTIGADKTAAVFNKDDEQVVAILKGHSKKVNRVIYHPSGENIVITASYDATIRIWDVPTSQVKIILFGTGRLKQSKCVPPKHWQIIDTFKFTFLDN